jgi:hypothetical protein
MTDTITERTVVPLNPAVATKEGVAAENDQTDSTLEQNRSASTPDRGVKP